MTKVNLNGLVVSIFMDDIKIIVPKESGITQCVKEKLTAVFSIADIGLISFYLGIKVEQNRAKQRIKLSEPVYIDKVLVKFYFDKAHAINTPMKKTALFQSKTEGQATTSESE